MKTIQPALFAFVALAILGTCSTASAQGRPMRYAPARPVFSPYLAYSTTNSTGIPSYYSYVRPMEQFDVLVRASRTPLNAPRSAAAARMRLDESEVADLVARRLEMRETTGVGMTATPGTYLDYSHYYPGATSRAGTPGRR